VGKMLIDTSVTIAYKCTSCGSFEFFNISLFTLLYKKDCSLPCRCKKSCVNIKQECEGSFLISIPCIGCGNDHTYLLSKKNILSGEPIIFNCPETDLQIFFIGRDEAVRKKVDSLEEEFDEMIDMYGYESYFDNTQVMFDTLNRIHDIALKGNLSCECGSVNIELVLLSGCVLLRCGKCGSSRRIPASKNKDLKDILTKSQITITEEFLEYNHKNGKDILPRKLSDKFGK
jgi:hypothetical protein